MNRATATTATVNTATGPADACALPAGTDETEDAYRLHRRFDRIGRLVGDEGMRTLLGSSAMVIGLGGVGSYAAEALARSGVGRLWLVDFDRVCITNSNRQLQAMKGEVGRYKADVLAERLARINPQARVEPVRAFYNAATSARIFAERPDIVIDAIDNLTAKCHLLALCRAEGVPVITSTGASGRMDPTQIRTGDLAETRIDPMAASVRKILRQEHAFPRKGAFGIPAVYSLEPIAAPIELHYDEGKGFRCVCPGGKNDLHSCEERRVIYGTAAFVTGSFGNACAGLAVRALVGG